MSKMFNLDTVNISFTIKMLECLFHYTFLLQQLLSLNLGPIQYAVKIVLNLDIIFEDLDAEFGDVL